MATPASPNRPHAIRVAWWTVFFLLVLDLAANVAFRYPEDPAKGRPSRLQAYFEYGRSVEGKLRAATRPTDEASAPILTLGWLDRKSGFFASEPAERGAQDRLMISLYGMSHARQLAIALDRVTDDITIRSVTAPAATPNWTFAAYSLDRKREDRSPRGPDAVVYSLLSSSVPMIETMTNATAFFDQSRPYTQPRYRIEGGQRVAIEPPFQTVGQYREVLADSDRWGEYRRLLAEHDPYYDPLLFRESILDASALVRVLRRGYAISSRRRLIENVHGPAGFDPDSREIILLRRLVSEFAASARADRQVPVVYLVNSLGDRDDLFRVLKPTLDAEAIPFVSSHTMCSPSDYRCYRPDSHFIPEVDDRLATEIVRVVDSARR